LVEQREWHEAKVTQYQESGRHFVEFCTIPEKRWLDMLCVAFYILKRPSSHLSISASSSPRELRFVEEADELLTPVEDDWVYVEDISLDYAFAQSVLFKIFGENVQETGHKTRGHLSLTNRDKEFAREAKGSLLYGELLPRGINKALGYNHMHAGKASTLFDLGMGTGKVVIQAFLQFPNLTYVQGVELSQGRFNVAVEAVIRMVHLLGTDAFNIEIVSNKSLTVTELANPGTDKVDRILHLEFGSLFDAKNIDTADIVMLETDVPPDTYSDLCTLLSQLKSGARVLSYLDLDKIWPSNLPTCSFRQLAVNRPLSDRYPTSWSVQRGHHFFLFRKRSEHRRHVSGYHVPDTSVASPSSREVSVQRNQSSDDVNQRLEKKENAKQNGRSPRRLSDWFPVQVLKSVLFGSSKAKSNAASGRSGNELPKILQGGSSSQSSGFSEEILLSSSREAKLEENGSDERGKSKYENIHLPMLQTKTAAEWSRGSSAWRNIDSPSTNSTTSSPRTSARDPTLDQVSAFSH
jgi:hypothetical protein